ncbi:MAG: hypothetical protein ABSH05_17820 [Bryobacteraceae bacterium]|jgi:hypothetical protein
MIIRPQQMEAFQGAAQASFEAEALEHIRKDYPQAVKGVEETRLKQLISKGAERARGHGFKARGPVRMFLDFLVILGHEFDRDPMLFWVGDILKDREGLDEMVQAARLHLHVTTYLDLVYGRGGEHVGKGLEHIVKALPQELTAVGRSLESSAIPWLQKLHPRKCAYAGATALTNLVQQAQQASARCSLPTPEGPPLLLGLMFAFGSGVLTDPLFPWVAASLEGGGEPKARLERLTARTQTYLRQALENRSKG